MTKKKSSNNRVFLRKRVSFSYLHIAVFALLFGTIGLYTVLQSSAAPRSGGGKPISITGTISSYEMQKDNNNDGLPNWGDSIRFIVSTNPDSKEWVNLKCYQNGTLVGEGWETYFEGGLGDGVFGLAGNDNLWKPDLKADCTAYLKVYDGKGKDDYTTITSRSFIVNP